MLSAKLALKELLLLADGATRLQQRLVSFCARQSSLGWMRAVFAGIAVAALATFLLLPNGEDGRTPVLRQATVLPSGDRVGHAELAVDFCGRKSGQLWAENLACLKASALKGNVAAAASAGTSLFSRASEVEDYHEAVKWLQIASDGGDAESSFDLAWIFDVGRGEEKDVNKAVALYRQALSGGEVMAAWNLGVIYRYGPEELRSEARAFSYFQTAAYNGVTQAFFVVGRSLLVGEGTKPDPEAAAKWLESEARNGSTEGMRLLSGLYHDGIGHSVDLVEAYKWVSLYRERADSISSIWMSDNAMRQLGAQMTSSEIAEAQKRVAGWKEEKGSVSSVGTNGVSQ